MESITTGSKETLLVDITDRLQNLTNLAAANPRYDVYDKNNVVKMNDQAAIAVGMQAQCLIDTTLGGNWTPGHYYLYVRFANSPDSPRLGPLEFKVNP